MTVSIIDDSHCVEQFFAHHTCVEALVKLVSYLEH